MTILDEILHVKRREVLNMLAEQDVLQETRPSRPSLFKKLYKTEHLQVIAEMKRASPSKGLIAEGADPVAQAISYYNAGAACISVLTDNHFFKGSFKDLAAVADNVPIPLLCKEFIIHTVQIDRAKNAGASVILLIVAALTDDELSNLHAYALASGLEVLVEVHDEAELKRAIAINAKLIGVNNRDLRTFKVDLKRTEEIAALFPFDEERVLISESGIWESEDALFVADAGASAVLVGESLMRSGAVARALQSLQVALPRVVR
ncbi:indole-3-glycerol phosphate synthase TrpC [Sporosarcina sp. E16_8]|uniref:indole-3-glycerol phosphate synthase TrpC n=1 Tax=Sporosarcina sp. E16_8 TaxID=2789295 RepID=UPI001A90F9B6|nr:indole-3-glycerol phosphate synthase TrpC [Sporosarcina sp. E16_8]MBO0588681.1 indole-3-glycerol phosphate synthase TrpC [Sporosarcina sp. E16_8]